MTPAAPKHAVVLSPSREGIEKAAQALRAGELVAMPTETVYGLAGAGLEASALSKIFAAKERPTFDPLILHVSWPTPKDSASGVTDPLTELERRDLIHLEGWSDHSREKAQKLLLEFWPGPLTLVLPKHPRVPDLATSGLPQVALRMPRHPVARALIEASGMPLAAPSANRFGRISPTRAEHVQSELGERIGWILDGGPSEVGVESTVIRMGAQGEAQLLRPGGIAAADIERVLGHPLLAPPSMPVAGPSGSPGAQLAPGLLESHYAPRKPFFLLPSSLATLPENLSLLPPFQPLFQQIRERGARVGFLSSSPEGNATPSLFSLRFGRDAVAAETLSPAGDAQTAAQRLFSLLRWLDESAATVLVAEPWTREIHSGLGHAIQDRLKRASARNQITL